MTGLAVVGAIFIALILIGFCSATGDDTYYYGLGLVVPSPTIVSRMCHEKRRTLT
ncbi:hypothetical protein GCM10009721_38810 [Terrabacter tumescens]|uniref:Uncharacterized protein n=2 Tax=Terrabacter tumescens TaxID=60443 RepID=A0ABQ2II19_9MICO|nr:hypothetical protein GCM10009721_38810 [Terrabacter tumescens]